MTATVISLSSRRKRSQGPAACCGCSPAGDFLCYPHRLAELMDRVTVEAQRVEDFRFCDVGTFDRVSSDVLKVVGQIVRECLPDERGVR